MSNDYYVGQVLRMDYGVTHGTDHWALVDAPKGLKLYSPDGRVVVRGYPGVTNWLYGNEDGHHVFQEGEYVVVELPGKKDKVWELARQLWNVRNGALVGTRWEDDPDLADEDSVYQDVYRALARFVIQRDV